MSKDRKLDDSELANISGAGDVNIKPRPDFVADPVVGKKEGPGAGDGGGSGGQVPPEGTESGGDQGIEGV